MSEVARGGRTVLFVSHNMQAVTTLCSRGIALERGALAFHGTAQEAVRHYLSKAGGSVVLWEGDVGDDVVRLRGTSVAGESPGIFRTDEALRIRMRCEVRRRLLGLVCAVEIFNQNEERLVYSAVDDCAQPPATEVAPGNYHWELTIPPNVLAAGNYRFDFDVGIHNVGRIVRGQGALSIKLENVAGVGRRFLAHDNVIRPDWSWRLLPG
jgi:lipopolysaccharide transport system ATP-binding protein